MREPVVGLQRRELACFIERVDAGGNNVGGIKNIARSSGEEGEEVVVAVVVVVVVKRGRVGGGIELVRAVYSDFSDLAHILDG
jgi:hypothetical protein